MEQTTVEAVRSMTNKEMVVAIIELQSQVKSLQEALSAKSSPTQTTSKEMTDEDARAILTGAHAASKHKDAASALGLTYGQVYSCRLEYTFKHIHKELKEAGFKNGWTK
jgi:predicted Zn-dependent protease